MELALEAAPVGNIQQEVDIRGSLQFLDSRLRLGQLGPEPANGPLGVIGRRGRKPRRAQAASPALARLGAALRAAALVLRRFAAWSGRPGLSWLSRPSARLAPLALLFFMGHP